MEFWRYALVVIVGFLGLFVGLILAFVAKEELQDGKRYFIWMQRILLVAAGVCSALFLKQWILGVILVVATVGCVAFFWDKPAIPFFVLFAVFLGLSRNTETLLAINGSLLFVFGYTVASLSYHETSGKKEKDWKQFLGLLNREVLKHVYMPVLALILFFLLNSLPYV